MDDFPDIEIDKVDYLSNRALAHKAGVRSIPALVHGETKLTGILLTKGRIRSFLESL